MKCFAGLFAVLIFCASMFAQAPVPTGKVPGERAEGSNVVYVGFARTFTDFGEDYDFNGVDASITRYLTRRLGVVGEFEFGKNGPFEATYYAYRGGARYDFATGRYRPFGQFTLGAAEMTGLVGIGAPPVIMEQNWSGFSWAGGGGLDMHVNRHWGARVQFMHERVPFGTHVEARADWNRLSGGFTFRW